MSLFSAERGRDGEDAAAGEGARVSCALWVCSASSWAATQRAVSTANRETRAREKQGKACRILGEPQKGVQSDPCTKASVQRGRHTCRHVLLSGTHKQTGQSKPLERKCPGTHGWAPEQGDRQARQARTAPRGRGGTRLRSTQSTSAPNTIAASSIKRSRSNADAPMR